MMPSALSAQQLRGLLDTTVDGFLVIDEAGVVLSFNRAAETLFGYAASEVLGRNVSMLMGAPHAGAHDGYLHSYLTTGRAGIIGKGREVEGRRRDGSMVPLSLSVSEMQHEGKRYFSGIVRDLTERREAEARERRDRELLARRARFDRTEAEVLSGFVQAPTVAAALEQPLRLLAERHGLPVSAVYVTNELRPDVELVAKHGVSERLASALTDGAGLVGQVARSGRPLVVAGASGALTIDVGIGRITPAEVRVVPLVYADVVRGVLVTCSLEPLVDDEVDFVERLALLMGMTIQRMEQYEEMVLLSQRLNERNREIGRKNEELRRASRLKSEFLANMSHELRTPLTAILGFADVLSDGLAGPVSDDQRSYLGEIVQAGTHLLSVIGDILDMSKIEAGKMDLELGLVDMGELVDACLSVVREPAFSKGLVLERSLASLPLLYVDGRRVKQILINLLSNAVKFTEKGRVEVVVACHPPDAPEWLAIDVVDTGAGVPPESIERMFQPFEQLDGSATRQHEGTGLGLALVRRLVALHGGEIDVDTTPGVGTSFQIRLPFIDAGAERAQVLLSPSPLARHGDDGFGCRVLLIEDDADAASMVREELRSLRCEMVVAPTGEEGIEHARVWLPDVIILDLLLPDTDGWSLLTRLRADPVLAEVPIVILSIVADQRKGLAMGAYRVLQKPLQPDDLLDALADLGLSTDGAAPRVLVVDDAPRVVEMLARRLELQGFDTLRAYGGQEAIRIVKADRPHVVVLDLMMPDMSGFDVVAVLQADDELAKTPIIVLTAMELTQAQRQQLHGRVVSLVEKHDFDPRVLVGEVRRAMWGG